MRALCVSVVLLAVAAFAACSSKSPGLAPSCSQLSLCCLNAPAGALGSCESVVTANDAQACTTTYGNLTLAGSCGVTIPLDGGAHDTGTTNQACALLASCCAKAPTSVQAACSATVAAGVSTTCASTESALTAANECGGSVGVPEAGAPAMFTGPSCPSNAPPNDFAPAGASATCASCAANCVTAQGLDVACKSYFACYCACAAGDTACQQACAPLNGACSDDVSAVTSCVATDCNALCSNLNTTTCTPITNGAACNPGVVTCGSSPCDVPSNVCCERLGQSTGTCSPASTGCADGGLEVTVSCDEVGDCPAGTVCCDELISQKCETACPVNMGGSAVQLCKSDSECTNGMPCSRFACGPVGTIQACEAAPFPLFSSGGVTITCTPSP